MAAGDRTTIDRYGRYPRNITDFFSVHTRQFSSCLAFDGLAHPDAGRFMPSSQRKLEMHLVNLPTNDTRIDIVRGVVGWEQVEPEPRRSSKTSITTTYIVHGIYLWQSGAAFLLASPALSNATLMDAYQDANSTADQHDYFNLVLGDTRRAHHLPHCIRCATGRLGVQLSSQLL